MTTTSKNLGLVAASIISTTAPENINVIWLDISGVPMIRKIWNAVTSIWEPLVNSGGGGGADNWGSQVVISNDTLDGDGTTATPLKIAQQAATSGQVLKWSGSAWLPADDDIGTGLDVVTNDTDIFDGDGTSGDKLRLKETTNGWIPKYDTSLHSGAGGWKFAPDAIGAVFLKNMIMLWSGTIAQIPAGWHLCDGNGGASINGVTIPNLSGKFIVGHDAVDSDFNVIGKIGGAKTVTLTSAQMPAHTHGVNDPGHQHATHFLLTTATGNGAGDLYSKNFSDQGSEEKPTSAKQTDISIQSTGGGTAHNNLPPFYTLAYIIYTE